jgi:hypothetical protein
MMMPHRTGWRIAILVAAIIVVIAHIVVLHAVASRFTLPAVAVVGVVLLVGLAHVIAKRK